MNAHALLRHKSEVHDHENQFETPCDTSTMDDEAAFREDKAAAGHVRHEHIPHSLKSDQKSVDIASNQRSCGQN